MLRVRNDIKKKYAEYLHLNKKIGWNLILILTQRKKEIN